MCTVLLYILSSVCSSSAGPLCAVHVLLFSRCSGTLCMHVCVIVHASVSMCKHVCLGRLSYSVYVCSCVYMCVHVVYVCTCVFMCVHVVYVCTCVFMCVYVCLCVHVCTCVGILINLAHEASHKFSIPHLYFLYLYFY